MCKRKVGFVMVVLLVFLIFLFSVDQSFAQATVPENPCDGTDPDMECPIDSGTIVLVTATLAYGFIKLYNFRQKKVVE